MKKDKTLSLKISTKDYDKIHKNASQKGISVSEYIRSLLKGDISKDWIKKTTVQQNLSRIASTLDKYEEKNAGLTAAIRKELDILWKKL